MWEGQAAIASNQSAHKNSAAPSDDSLLRRCSDGSEEAAALLYQRYAQRLRALVRARTSAQLVSRLDADDIVQSVFRSFFRVANTGLYEVPDGKDLWRLLGTIALNKVRTQGAFHRAAKRDVRLTATLGFKDPSRGAQTRKDEAGDTFFQLAIEEALDKLPPQQRAVVELRLQGYEVAEIAGQVGRGKRTVERHLQQALACLRDLFEEAP
jgi:RNA polymerase sigma-70 factor (ECF subfamily)